MNKFEQYFASISDEDLRQHELLMRKVRKATTYMLKAEANRLRGKGF